MSARAAEDGFKCYAIHAARLSKEAEQYLIGGRPELVGDNLNRPDSDGVFVYKRRGESEARVLVVELKHATEVCPSPSDEKTADDAVYQAIENDSGTTAKEYAETVTGEVVDPSRVTLLGITLMGTGQGPSQLTVKFDTVSLVCGSRIVHQLAPASARRATFQTDVVTDDCLCVDGMWCTRQVDAPSYKERYLEEEAQRQVASAK